MITEILREEIPCVEAKSSIHEALEILNTHDISEIAVTEQNRYTHILREIDLLSTEGKTLENLAVEREGHFVFEDDHVFLAFTKMNAANLSMIPVIDRELNYIGAITMTRIIDYLCESYSLSGEGSLIVLEQGIKDYSLTEISNIVEQEGGKILGVIVSPVQGSSENVWISLKLNTLSMRPIISSFERHEYNVVAQMNGEDSDNMIKERYESLMTFLNV